MEMNRLHFNIMPTDYPLKKLNYPTDEERKKITYSINAMDVIIYLFYNALFKSNWSYGGGSAHYLLWNGFYFQIVIR